MRRGVACAVAVCLSASFAGLVLRAAHARPSVPLVDYYITAEVVGRAAGKNAAVVDLKWDYKCLGDRLGPATFNWTLKLRRRAPAERTVSLGSGTSKTGSRRVVVQPGRWQPVADPFRCETQRGAGSTTPEFGRPFDVPDYCGWSVAAVKGRATLEQRGAVTALRRGGAVTLGETIATRSRSSAKIRHRSNAGLVHVGPNSRVTVDGRHCPRTGAWKFVLARGTISAEVPRSAPRARYQLQSPNARTTAAARAEWVMTSRRAGRRMLTRVAVRTNRVSVANVRGRKAVVVRAGYATVVRGASPPSRPRRGG